MNRELKYKLKNCLETILEFENTLSQLNSNYSLKMTKEFEYINNVLNNIEEIEFSLEDIEKIEKITSKFLNEIKDLVVVKQHTKRQ